MKIITVVISVLFAGTMITGCSCVNFKSEYFSNKVAKIDEPNTDDERTLVGEYEDYLAILDSLADVWNGTDSLAMRYFMYKESKQSPHVRNALKFQNIRSSMSETIKNNMEIAEREIEQQFPAPLRKELIDFYSCFNLNKYIFFEMKNVVNAKIMRNSYGEPFFLVKKQIYDNRKHDFINVETKQPIAEGDIESFQRKYKEFKKSYKEVRISSKPVMKPS